MFHRLITGALTPRELRRYTALVAGIFWGTIFVAWLSYPAAHHYSIMSHTFSFLGSFDPQHNPGHWWIFSTAMTFWGVAALPLTAHIHRRLAAVSRWGAHLGALLMVTGCLGVILVAIFPDARGEALAGLEWTEIHEKAAILVAVGFTLANLWHGALLLVDRIRRGRSSPFNHHALAWPYLFWGAVSAAAVANQVRWAILYEQRKAAARAAGLHIGSSWGESLNTFYAFPLWENLVIYALFIFLIWFTLALPARTNSAERES